MWQHSVSWHEDGLSFNFNEETFSYLSWSAIIENYKAKEQYGKDDDVTTEKMPGKMLSGGGNNAKANGWNFCR